MDDDDAAAAATGVDRVGDGDLARREPAHPFRFVVSQIVSCWMCVRFVVATTIVADRYSTNEGVTTYRW